jgi:3-phenylpropionate/cinnamic acid dioxygenase small subunit
MAASGHGASSASQRPSSAIRPDSPEYADALQFLYMEAELLDSGKFEDWLTLLTPDIAYRMPARLTTRRRDVPGFSKTTYIFDDNLDSLKVRVARFGTNFAWAEDPPSRTRHFIANVQVFAADRPEELDAHENLLLYRIRSDQGSPDLFSGVRQDRLRLVNGSLRLAQRTILLDQTLVNARHLSILF